MFKKLLIFKIFFLPLVLLNICQDICPWNKFVPTNKNIDTHPKKWMQELSLNSLTWKDDEWSENLKGTTLKRIKPWMWRRNIRASVHNK